MSNEVIDPELYASPTAAAPEKVVERDWGKASWGVLKHLGLAVLVFVVTFVLMIITNFRVVGSLGFGAATLLAVTGAARGMIVLVQRAMAPGSTAPGLLGTV